MKNKISISILFAVLLFQSPVSAQWVLQNVGTTNDVNCVDYFSSTEIWLGANDGLIKSTNGGGSWNTYPLIDNLGNQILGSYLLDIHVFSSTTAVATGVMFAGNNECILRTTNGGLNWTIVNNYNGGPLLRYLNDIHFPTATTGFAVGTNGRILKSTNAGANWSSQASGTTVELKSVFFTSALNGFAVGSNLILKTVNGGSNWTQTSFAGSGFNSVFFC